MRYFVSLFLLIFTNQLFPQDVAFPQALHPDLPFTYVKVDDNTPAWAKLLYGENPNIREINALYSTWRAKNPDVKNGHTRNYKHYLAYLIQNQAINAEGFVELPTDELALAKAWQKKRNSILKNKSSLSNPWTAVGPNLVPITQGRVNAQSNVYAIDQSKSNPDILYMGTETNYIFKSTDHGLTWNSISDDYVFGGYMEVEIHPTNPDIVYLATSHDIMKTTDGGATWVSVRYNFNQRMSSIIIDPSDPETVIAGGVEGMYRTENGGATWTTITTTRVFDLKFKSDDPNVVFALWNNSTALVTDFYRSTDNGVSWNKISTGWDEPNGSTANSGGRMTTSDIYSGVIYTFTGAKYTHLSDPKNGIKIRKSSDAGLTWSLLVDSDDVFTRDGSSSTTIINNGQGYYDWDIEMMDADTNMVMLGTQNKWLTDNGFSNNTLKMWGSTVGGHSDMQEALFNGDDFWVATDGGLVKCDPGLIGYEIRMEGVNCAEFWSFDQGWNRDAQVGSLYHNGTIGSTDTYDDGIFRFFGGAEPSFSALKHPYPDKIISKGYGSVDGRSMPDNFDDPETSFNYNLVPNSNYAIWLTNEESEIEPSPYNYNIHWAGEGNRLMKSLDFGFTWTESFVGRVDGKITKIEIPKANSDIIYVGEYHSSGYAIYKSVDNGATFRALTGLPDIAGSDDDGVFMSCDHSDENILFIGFRENDNDNDKVWKTVDGGVTWTNINNGSDILDGESMTDLLAISGTDGDVYVTTNHGVFHKSNNSDWIACIDGLPVNLNIRHIEPFYKEGKIRIGTMFRGVYSMDMINEPTEIVVQPTVSNTEGRCSKDTFFFEDYSVLNHDGASWAWSFEPAPAYVDNANIRNPKVVFPANGTYQAYLSVTQNGQTITDTLDQPIILNSLCEPDKYAGKSYSMSAYGEYADVGNIGGSMSEWTVSFWVKPKVNAINTSTMFDILDSNNSRQFCANFSGSSMNPTMHYLNAGSNAWGVNPNMALTADEWNHLAYTSSVITGNVTIYVNGVPFVYPNVNAVPIEFDRILVGWQYAWWGGRWYDGEFDELAIYNRALSQDEIRLRMHITKDLTNDVGLIHYYQWNEGIEGTTYDKVNIKHLSLRGSIVESNGPFAKGTSSKMNVTSGGLKQFTNEGLELTFPPSGTYPNGELVVTRLDTVPDFSPSEDEGSNKYWVIHNFGANNNFSALTNIKFTGYGVLSSTEASNPTEFELYQRNFGQDENTWGNNIDLASTIEEDPINKITYLNPGITSFGQYYITKGDCISEPIIANSLNSGAGSLRQALLDACPSDTITFNLVTDNNPLLVNTMLLDIDKDVYIMGNGNDRSIINGNSSNLIFRILDPSTKVGMEKITLQNGFDTSNGGALINKGQLRIKDCIFMNNFEGLTPKAFTNSGKVTIEEGVEIEE